MNKKVIALIFFFLSFQVFSQNVKEDIQKNLYKIRTIDPLDTIFSDLSPLRLAIGDSRIVMLGEQGHGDAPSFIAKTRIIKYLHENMGFDILAFESGFYGLSQTNQDIERVKKNIYPIWTKCLQCGEIFNYIENQQKTKNH